jgi:hypothetical protein
VVPGVAVPSTRIAYSRRGTLTITVTATSITAPNAAITPERSRRRPRQQPAVERRAQRGHSVRQRVGRHHRLHPVGRALGRKDGPESSHIGTSSRFMMA